MILGNLECMGWISPPPINIQNACTIRVKNGNFYKQYCLGLMHSHSHAFSTPCKVLKINLLQTLKHLSPQHSHLSKNKRVHLFLVCTRGCQFVLFMQITTFCTCKHKPNLQVKAKKTVCITPKSLLFSILFFGLYIVECCLWKGVSECCKCFS